MVSSLLLEEEACQTAMKLSTCLIFAAVFNTAIELDLFNIIAKAGPGAYVSASEIASQLPTTNPDAPVLVDRMLHLLATHSVLSYSPRTIPEGGRIEKTYALTPACKYFTGSVEDGNLSFRVRYNFRRASLGSFLNMKDVILEGESSFKKTNGISVFEYMGKDEEFNYMFNQQMVGISSVIMNGILPNYKGFEGLNSLVDVGGGTGRVLNMIVSKYPSIKAINFDLPHVIQSAPPYPGIEHIGGNMFDSVPKGEAIMIKSACHNWGDEDVIKVLKKINEALPENGKLIIIEVLMPEKPEISNASQYTARLDNLMFIKLHPARQRSAHEFEALTKAAGFANFKVSFLDYGIWGVMESHK
ncbi:O-methyltransferase family protein [Euphorbia peplus]|nr:O-methyltransferase family protein [Euphorbia peplus]